MFTAIPDSTLRFKVLCRTPSTKAALLDGLAPCHSDADLTRAAYVACGESMASVFGTRVTRHTDATATVVLFTD